jgi:hypothetical protein
MTYWDCTEYTIYGKLYIVGTLLYRGITLTERERVYIRVRKKKLKKAGKKEIKKGEKSSK